MDVQDRRQNPSLLLGPRNRSLQQYPSNFDFKLLATVEGSALTSISSSPSRWASDLSSGMQSSSIGTFQSLFVDEPFVLAPPMAVNGLNVPYIYNELPELINSCEVPPNLFTKDIEGSDNWPPLVTDHNVVAAASAAPGVDECLVTKSDDCEAAETAPNRPKSRELRSLLSSHSSDSGVRSRRRHKSLPAINVENINDLVAIKRARNTIAARKCRERKAIKFEELEEKIRKLEADLDHWKQVAIAHGASLECRNPLLPQ